MKVSRAIKVELDPNNKVRTLLYQHAGAKRFAWNWDLARRNDLYKTNSKYSNAQEANKLFVKLKKAPEFHWWKDISARVHQEAFRDLDRAFHNFFTRKNEGVGLPNFKSKHGSQDSFRLYGTFKVFPHSILLPTLGTVRTKEPLNEKDKITDLLVSKIKGRITSVSISRTADRWFASILFEQEVEEPEPIEGSEVCGIDLGIKTFATLSDGTEIHSPRPLKKAMRQLKHLQRKASKKKKGSNNRYKANKKVAKIHAKVANQRKDFLHRITTNLAKTKPVIVIEDLKTKNLMRNHKLAGSISDLGWGEFRRQLTYKTEWYGSKLIVADAWFPSSQICSECGFRVGPLGLKIRTWECPNCHKIHNRDHNAAKNLSKYPECQGNWKNLILSKPVEIPPGAGSRDLVIRGSLNQEVSSFKHKTYKESDCQPTG